jgi:putative hydrolase of the HAD superfamily
MAVRAVVFDVGNVLELSQDNYVFAEWAVSLGLTSAEFAERLQAATNGGDVGTVTLEEVHHQLGKAFGIDDAQVNEIMERVWREYLGTANTELTEWARTLRPRFKTGNWHHWQKWNQRAAVPPVVAGQPAGGNSTRWWQWYQ